MVAEYRFPYDWLADAVRVTLHVVDRVREIMFKRDHQFLELFNAILSFLWGFWCLAMRPFDTMNLVIESFNRVAPDWFWTIVFLALGFAMFYGLIFEKMRLRQCASCCAFFWWLNISAMLAWSYPALFALPVAVMVCIVSGVIYMRLVRENVDER